MDNRLPHNDREGIVYGMIIAGISSLLIGGYNAYDSMGYGIDSFGDFLMDYMLIWPVMFLIAFCLANFVVGRVAVKVLMRYVAPEDSVNARLAMNIMVCVLMMSAILTFVGGLVGGSIGAMLGGQTVEVVEVVRNWPRIWPRNFCIAFWVEMLIAQPAARMAMVRVHTPRARRNLRSD